MYYCIHTKFLPVTETLGARIKATMGKDSLTIPYPFHLSGGECHREAAKKLQEKLRTTREPGAFCAWDRYFHSGELPDGSWAHVFVD